MLDAMDIFKDSLPPNTTTANMGIKCAFKYADGGGD